MEKKTNCWEFMKCGREPGGIRAELSGICKSATDIDCDGINGGTNGGRICWAISGTMCQNNIDGTFARKITTCMKCDFYRLVLNEEGSTAFSLKILDDAS